MRFATLLTATWNGLLSHRALMLVAPSVLLLNHVSAQCNCTCDALIPASQQINAVLMNEDGSGPTHFVSAGGPGGSAREIRHGNLFSGAITITHVCIALKSPTGQPGEIANIQIYQPDPDPINMNLPGAMMYDQQFQINASFNDHQIVQLVTPQTMTSNFWLVVAYPTAQPAIGHQGTRPRTMGNSAVYIDGPPGAGFVPGWKYYDDLGGPGGTAGYLGNAPIIRPLNIGPSGAACPYDPQCCNTVCSIDPSCCVSWHPLCDQLALNNCFPAGCGNCPPTGIAENEPCDTDVNGGCDTNGIFTSLQCDTTICGSLWRSSTTGLFDTDWYRIDLTDPDGSGQAFFTFNVESEAPIEVLLQNDFCPNDIPYVIYTGANTQTCITTVFGGAVPSPGTYRISVKRVNAIAQCPNETKYTLWVDVDDCATAPPPPNDDCANAGLVILNPGDYTFITDGATTDGPARPCGFNGVNDADVWFQYIAPCNGTATISLISSFDHLLSIYTDCPAAGGTLIGCGAGSGPAAAAVTFQTTAGQIYVVRAGGLNGVTGTATLTIDFQTCAADIAPQPGNCIVDVDDLLGVINHWGSCPQPCPPSCPGDIVQNCSVDVDDLLAVINLWGPCP